MIKFSAEVLLLQAEIETAPASPVRVIEVMVVGGPGLRTRKVSREVAAALPYALLPAYRVAEKSTTGLT